MIKAEQAGIGRAGICADEFCTCGVASEHVEHDVGSDVKLGIVYADVGVDIGICIRFTSGLR